MKLINFYFRNLENELNLKHEFDKNDIGVISSNEISKRLQNLKFDRSQEDDNFKNTFNNYGHDNLFARNSPIFYIVLSLIYIILRNGDLFLELLSTAEISIMQRLMGLILMVIEV